MIKATNPNPFLTEAASAPQEGREAAQAAPTTCRQPTSPPAPSQDVQEASTPAPDIRIASRDLIAIEPQQAIINTLTLAVTAPLADLLASSNLLVAAQPRLRAGDHVKLLHFADAGRSRLLEVVTVAIVQSLPNSVAFAPLGPIATMPEPPVAVTQRVEERLTIVRVEHDYRVVKDVEPANGITLWLVQDGPARTVEIFKGPEAAEQFAADQRASFPDFVVQDARGKAIGGPFRTQAEAEQFKGQEMRRREAAIKRGMAA